MDDETYYMINIGTVEAPDVPLKVGPFIKRELLIRVDWLLRQDDVSAVTISRQDGSLIDIDKFKQTGETE